MPVFEIMPGFHGELTNADLLSTTGSLAFAMHKSEMEKGNPGHFFSITSDDGTFVFDLGYSSPHIVASKNNEHVWVDIGEASNESEIIIRLSWNPEGMSLRCIWRENQQGLEASINFKKLIFAPNDLITWARKQNLVPSEEYSSKEVFRNRIISCLQSIDDKIKQAGSYDGFWNIQYDGNKIVSRTPKKEVEIHPIVQCLLHDQALLGSFEVIPEYHTGVGDLDFLIMGRLQSGGYAKVFVEFKNAHSQDIIHGLVKQLPAYMRNQQVDYGMYVILNYSGEWFDHKFDLHELFKAKMTSRDPLIEKQIRVIEIELSKPLSASKRE